jgi:hypothetical protein
MRKEPCGCEYDGPVQVLTCGSHNAAAKNVDRAQVMINERDMEIHFLKEIFKRIRDHGEDPDGDPHAYHCKEVVKLAEAGLNFKLPKEIPFTKEELDLLINSPFKCPPESKG